MRFIQRRINVDATLWRCIDVDATLYKRHMPAGGIAEVGNMKQQTVLQIAI